MRKMLCEAQCAAREREAVMLRARVPSGSESHLSGNRFAAPWELALMTYRWRILQCTTTCGLRPSVLLGSTVGGHT
jgi:hypothetical protein